MLLKNPITEDKTIWAGLNHPELPLEEADIAVFGIPYDGGVSFRSGTCEAPQELRKITHTISPTTEDFRDISPVKVKDLGDCVGKDRDEMFAEAEELAYQAVKAGKFFTMIGGDHSVTIPVHRASTGRWRRTSVSSTSTPTSISATRCTGTFCPTAPPSGGPPSCPTWGTVTTSTSSASAPSSPTSWSSTRTTRSTSSPPLMWTTWGCRRHWSGWCPT